MTQILWMIKTEHFTLFENDNWNLKGIHNIASTYYQPKPKKKTSAQTSYHAIAEHLGTEL